MSSDVCRTCKHSGTCTYPHNQTIIQCEEYEYADLHCERRASHDTAPQRSILDKGREVAQHAARA